jgi:hypothetical protein
MANRFEPRTRVRDAENSVVYRNDREFAGWPFIGGLWTTADGHYVLGFDKKACDYAAPTDVNHDEVAKIGPQSVVIRSEDRGRTWDSGSLQVLFDRSIDEDGNFAGAPEDYSGHPPVDFADADVLVASSASPDYCRPHSRAWIRLSADGGLSWRPPILVPMVGLHGLSGHGSSLVRPDGVSLVFLTAISADGWKRRPVVFASIEGGSNWTFLSFIAPNIDDGAADSDRTGPLRFGAHRYFYPRGILLPGGRILASIRCQRDPTSILWTEMFQSNDGGRTWRFLSRVNDWGAPGDIVRMADGRIACVYGYRLPPFGVRARISEDDGRTWGRELVLRDDGGSWDLGYPRVIEREPGTLLAVYYMNRRDDPIQMNGGVRHIAQTVFIPD